MNEDKNNNQIIEKIKKYLKDFYIDILKLNQEQKEIMREYHIQEDKEKIKKIKEEMTKD